MPPPAYENVISHSYRNSVVSSHALFSGVVAAACLCKVPCFLVFQRTSHLICVLVA